MCLLGLFDFQNLVIFQTTDQFQKIIERTKNSLIQFSKRMNCRNVLSTHEK